MNETPEIDRYYEMKIVISYVPPWSLHTRIGIKGVDLRDENQ